MKRTEMNGVSQEMRHQTLGTREAQYGALADPEEMKPIEAHPARSQHHGLTSMEARKLAGAP
eukprot:5297847-Pyramimonas_sp.AAC.1